MAASRTLPLDVEPGWPPGSLEAHLRQDQLSKTTLGLWGRRYRRRVGRVTGGGAAWPMVREQARLYGSRVFLAALPDLASGPVKPSLFRFGQIRPRHRAIA